MPVRCLRPPCTAVGGAKTSKSAPLVALTLYSSFKQAKGGLGDRIEPLEPTGSDFSDLQDGGAGGGCGRWHGVLRR
ncbi:hypothetical protein ES288_A02G049800v1 [Gossypium darwinii]|uniref:Uncharacterized protein n=1 Tax=Gossypium darwinii TaxID=34276 RepID=A0A5D2HB72_GOSDA|nr:hypothetical protein ES288_A02G049800v1 [Gossypium darwinii]